MEQEKQGLISVIIPVYNVEKYLQECVDSVLAQTYQNFEIILVDDGSTDSSGAICDEYAKQDERISVLHQENKGLSITRNNGLQIASGEYIYFLDSDDWIENSTLEILLQEITKESADVVFMDAKSFVEQKEKEVEQRYIRKKKYDANNGIQMLTHLIEEKDYHSSVPLLFMKANFLKRNSLEFIAGIVYEDMVFTYEVFLKAQRVSHVNEALYQRRYRSNSIMTSKKKIKDYVSAKIVYEKVSTYVSEEEVTKSYVIRCAFNALNIYKKLSLQERKEYKKDYKELKRNLLEKNAYGNRALKMRCYGVGVWFFYKVFEKVFKK